MILLRIYLLLGLVVHKVIWEALKNRSRTKPVERVSTKLTAVKAVKIAILLGAFARIEEGTLALTDSLRRDLEDMIRRSSNTAATVVMVDRSSGSFSMVHMSASASLIRGSNSTSRSFSATQASSRAARDGSEKSTGLRIERKVTELMTWIIHPTGGRPTCPSS